jgi:hypothetical protein
LEKVDLIYDHYKETMQLSLNMQKRRGTLFVVFCIFEILNFSMLLFPEKITASISQYILSQYNIKFDFSIAILQSAIWIVLSYIMIRYYQTNIYIERQYKYIAILEDKISIMLKEPCFKRESDNYLEKYPIVLDLISVFYTWIIPLLIIVINVGKLSMEFRTTSNLWSAIFDTLCCGFTVVLTIMYLVMMHPRYKNS